LKKDHIVANTHTKFISPSSLFAEVKETFFSYFQAGALDDVLFPTWLSFCLDKLKRTALKKKATFITINNYKGDLPEDFDSVYAAWLCDVEYSQPILNPTYHYFSKDITIERVTNRCDVCQEEEDSCSCDPCEKQEKFFVTKKRMDGIILSYKTLRLLEPASLPTLDKCHNDCLNIGYSCPQTFTIDGCDFNVNFFQGGVHLVYYAKEYDDHGYQLIPDDVYIKEYISKFLKFKLYEKLFNSTTDETFNQIRLKYDYANNDYKQAFVQASIQAKKQNKQQMLDSLKRNKRRFHKLIRRSY